MQRGLKESCLFIKRHQILFHVSMQRGLKGEVGGLTALEKLPKSQCKEDWKTFFLLFALSLLFLSLNAKRIERLWRLPLLPSFGKGLNAKRIERQILPRYRFVWWWLRLNAKRIESDVMNLLRNGVLIYVSMQRGLKVNILYGLLKNRDFVSMQRGLKASFCLIVIIAKVWMSQCKEDWKSCICRLIYSTATRESQCKEDWKAVTGGSRTPFPPSLVSMQRGLKVQLTQWIFCEVSKVSMQRGLKVYMI